MAVTFDKAAEFGIAAQGFQTERPGAGEEVNYPGPADLASEYGEERFFHAIGNGPGRAPRWRKDSSAAMEAGYDSHGFTLRDAKATEQVQRANFYPRQAGATIKISPPTEQSGSP